MGGCPGRRAEREPVEATVGCAKPWERGMSVGDSAGLLAGRTGVVISVGLRRALESMPVGAVIGVDWHLLIALQPRGTSGT